MQAYRLVPHTTSSPLQVSSIEARVKALDPNWLSLRWRIDGASELIVPKISGKSRADGLWRTTCFELFLKPRDAEGYFEWNFSPSRRWNAYSFSDYREGMCEANVAREPDSVWHGGSGFALFDVAVPRSALPDCECSMAIAAVIEESGGRRSYWSIAHPDADRPDFHHSACFAATLDPRG